jgi:hypothetical protein
MKFRLNVVEWEQSEMIVPICVFIPPFSIAVHTYFSYKNMFVFLIPVLNTSVLFVFVYICLSKSKPA